MPTLHPSQIAAARPLPTWLWPLALALAALAALAVDLPLGRWLLDGGMPKWLYKLCALSEIFAHGWGVALIAAAIFSLDPPGRLYLPRVLTAAFGAGLCANLVKLLIARARPRHFDFGGGVFDTFGPLLPLGRGGSGVQSFPSSHAATAFGLAVALAWLYPQGRRFFAVLAVLACLQRPAAGAHFLSDVLLGAALGIAFGGACVGRGALARCFDRVELAWSNRRRANVAAGIVADDGPNSAAA